MAIPSQNLRNNLEGKYLKGDVKHRASLMKSDLLCMEFNKYFIDYQFDKSVFENLGILTSPLNSEEENQNIQEIINRNLKDNQISIKKSDLRIRK